MRPTRRSCSRAGDSPLANEVYLREKKHGRHAVQRVRHQCDVGITRAPSMPQDLRASKQAIHRVCYKSKPHIDCASTHIRQTQEENRRWWNEANTHGTFERRITAMRSTLRTHSRGGVPPRAKRGEPSEIPRQSRTSGTRQERAIHPVRHKRC